MFWSSTFTTTAHLHRRTQLAGRLEPSFLGYPSANGRWRRHGRYDQLEVETRHFKVRGAFDSSAFPCTVTIRPSSKSASSSTRADRDLLHNQVTVTDNA